MDAAALAAFEGTWTLSHHSVGALCYAPFTNLYFDRFGRALVCCWNSQFPVGNILTHSIAEIWRGPAITELRETLARYEFARGCDFCHFQTADGVFGGVNMRKFDRFPVSSPLPDWPSQIEFSISNVCNLECAMYDGDHSSAIRTRREGRPSMPRLYSDAFLESLRPYLAHLNQAKFLGGEPFLATEHFRLWDMMVEDGLRTKCHVTTNGTQYSDRIERYIDQLDFGFCVSLDAVSKETYESIRVNASFNEVMNNAHRFRDYARQRKTAFSLGFCLMRQNWREFGRLCLMADAWDVNVGLSTVRQPVEMAIYSLPPEELCLILLGLEHEADELDRNLKRNKAVWFAEVERIRAKVRAVGISPTLTAAANAASAA